MRTSYPPFHARKLKKRRQLELGVLRYLKKTMQPVLWDELYVHYEKLRPGDVGPVFKELKEGQYISVDTEKRVTITQGGLKRLGDNQLEALHSINSRLGKAVMTILGDGLAIVGGSAGTRSSKSS